jgi:hypothetical protein
MTEAGAADRSLVHLAPLQHRGRILRQALVELNSATHFAQMVTFLTADRERDEDLTASDSSHNFAGD